MINPRRFRIRKHRRDKRRAARAADAATLIAIWIVAGVLIWGLIDPLHKVAAFAFFWWLTSDLAGSLRGPRP